MKMHDEPNDRHDYRNQMLESGGGRPSGNDFGDILKILLGGLMVVQILIWIVT